MCEEAGSVSYAEANSIANHFVMGACVIVGGAADEMMGPGPYCVEQTIIDENLKVGGTCESKETNTDENDRDFQERKCSQPAIVFCKRLRNTCRSVDALHFWVSHSKRKGVWGNQS